MLILWKNLVRENKILKEIDFGLIEGSDLRERKCALKNVVEYFCSVWYREYLDGLQERSRKSLGRRGAVIKVDDVVVIGEDMVQRHRWRLGTLG